MYSRNGTCLRSLLEMISARQQTTGLSFDLFDLFIVLYVAPAVGLPEPSALRDPSGLTGGLLARTEQSGTRLDLYEQPLSCGERNQGRQRSHGIEARGRPVQRRGAPFARRLSQEFVGLSAANALQNYLGQQAAATT